MKKKLRNLKIGQKINIVNTFIIIVILTLLSMRYFYENKLLLEKAYLELENMNNSIVNMVKISTKTSVRSYLKATAENDIQIIREIYKEYQNGILTKDQAMKNISKIILTQKIGKSGYAYILDSKGVILIHPYKELINTDISQYDFIKKQLIGKKGYIEYEWKNNDDYNIRKKAMYTEYFKEWDLIIAVSAYKDEYEYLINTDDFREEVLAIKFGEKGYSYIMNDKGIVKIHPNEKEGINVYNERDIKGKEFVKEICNKKNGTLSYFWANFDEERPTEKIVVYQYIPELNWIVVCGSYKEEFLAPLNESKKNMVLIFCGFLILYIFQYLFLKFSITKPIKQLISTIQLIKDKEKYPKMKIKNNDEIGQLSNEFNLMVESIENYEKNLEEMVNKRTLELGKTYRNLEKLNVIIESNEKFMNTLFETIPYPIFFKDENFRYTKCNSAFEKYIGKTIDEIYGKTVYEIFPKEFADIYHEKDKDLFDNHKEQRYESEVKDAFGMTRHVVFNKAVCLIDNKKVGIIGVIQDITEFKAIEHKLKEQSIKDPLTSLYNKRGINELGLALFGYSIRKQSEISVFMIDIDNFKQYNDKYGHQTGDLCLKKIAKAIKDSCVRSIDLVGRYGGEEFLVVLIDIDKDGIVSVAQKILDNIKELQIEHSANLGEKIVSVSIGIYTDIPKKVDDFTTFIENADKKLYIAKSKGKARFEI